jgi:hypothetical protein
MFGIGPFQLLVILVVLGMMVGTPLVVLYLLVWGARKDNELPLPPMESETDNKS